jgi:ubiquinone/menaquinone biosynthesis C-methylase UbiE
MAYIHGSTDSREIARLEKQARFCAPKILDGLDAAPGMNVLDLATGVGAMAGQLLQRFPGIHLFGIDLAWNQLRHAPRNHPGPGYAQGDGTLLPFRDETFERVHCSWMLEHVPDPVAVLREVKRVLRPGGYCHFVEVDNATFETRPLQPEIHEALMELNEVQLREGGDPYLGRRLGTLLTEAGFPKVVQRPFELHGSERNPQFFADFVEEFSEIFESLDESNDQAMVARMRAAAIQLRALLKIPGAELRYRGFIGQGWA